MAVVLRLVEQGEPTDVLWSVEAAREVGLALIAQADALTPQHDVVVLRSPSGTDPRAMLREVTKEMYEPDERREDG